MYSEEEKGRLYANRAAAMHGIPQFIIDRQFGHFEQIDPEYAQGIVAHMSKPDEKQETQKDMDRMALEEAQTAK